MQHLSLHVHLGFSHKAQTAYMIKVAPWRDMRRRKQILKHSFNLILNQVVSHKWEPPRTCLLKPRFAVNANNWSNYPADQRDRLRNPNKNAFWGPKCLIKLNSAAKKGKRKTFFCHWQKKKWLTILVSMLGKHRQKWKCSQMHSQQVW